MLLLRSLATDSESARTGNRRPPSVRMSVCLSVCVSVCLPLWPDAGQRAFERATRYVIMCARDKAASKAAQQTRDTQFECIITASGLRRFRTGVESIIVTLAARSYWPLLAALSLGTRNSARVCSLARLRAARSFGRPEPTIGAARFGHTARVATFEPTSVRFGSLGIQANRTERKVPGHAHFRRSVGSESRRKWNRTEPKRSDQIRRDQTRSDASKRQVVEPTCSMRSLECQFPAPNLAALWPARVAARDSSSKRPLSDSLRTAEYNN